MLKILVTTDGSKHSFRTVSEAIRITKPLNAEVTVLTVAHEIPLFNYHAGLASDQMLMLEQSMKETAENSAKEILKKTEAVFRENDMEVKTIYLHGHPGEVICQIADKGDYDLVIMGSRGLGGLKEFILGSVSNHVAHCSKKSILIVK
ncbi:MAG: universal stress protein [Bacillota bacterium]|nr:universal stress protein [Bacillota bacterium]